VLYFYKKEVFYLMAYLDTVRTAKEVVDSLWVVDGATDVAQDAKDRAEAAGVAHISYKGYAAALDNYESRDDVETLAHRRAREISTDDTQTDFTRAADYDPFA
jgi:hypothetical protein